MRRAFRFDCQADELPESIARRTLELEPDDALADFLRRVENRRAGRVRTALHGFLTRLLSDFDANALLRIYPMHLLSTEQWEKLLDPRDGCSTWERARAT